MRCPKTRRGGEAKLVAFVAGTVRGPEGARLRAHLDDCARCSEYVAGQKAIWQLLDEWEPEFPSAGCDASFGKDVAAKVANLPPEPWFAKSSRWVMGRVLQPALTVTAITAILAIGLYVRDPFATTSQHSSPGRSATIAPRIISPVEAEQMDRAFDDLQLLHQLDSVSDSKKEASRSL
jgi:hypothetical protein